MKINKFRKYIISIFLGTLVGPIFIFVAVLLDITQISFPIIFPIAISYMMILFFFIPLIKKERRPIAVISTVLLLLSATYSIFFIGELVVIGPKGERIPWTYLMVSVDCREETVASAGEFKQTDFDFYKPKCYSEFYAAKYGDTSLEISAFYYSGLSGNPFYSVPKQLFTKLFCGITDSKTAYENYKELLSNSGFLIKDGLDNFTARNETTIVYCQLDGKFIMVVKVDMEEEYLLNQTKIMKGMF